VLTPPAPSLYVQHALALIESADFLLAHFYSFRDLLTAPEAADTPNEPRVVCEADEVEIKEAIAAFQALTNCLWNVARSLQNPILTDTHYRERIEHTRQHSGFMPLEGLHAIRTLIIQAEDYSDALSLPAAEEVSK
jgi:hypothetical protein